MSSLREIRRRIRSVRNTSKITHAMELVSAAKMKRAQSSATAGKAYADLVNDIISSIANRIDAQAHPLLARPEGNRTLVLIFSTDRGLAGSLNSNLFRQLQDVEGKSSFVSFGKKGRKYILKSGQELLADFPLPEKPDLQSVKPISRLIIDKFLSGEFSQVYILYSQFISTLRQEAVFEQLLPIIDLQTLEELSKTEKQNYQEPLFEPNPDAVLEAILPQYILMELYQILLEVKASEHSARMVAMKNATENALELVDDLTLTYNGIRQEAITNEILDISTAAVALE